MFNYHVFYHFPCSDGEISKTIWEIYMKPLVNTTIYYKWNHADIADSLQYLQQLNSSDIIVFLDVCPPLKYLYTHHNYIIIDHHQNAITTMETDVLFKNYNIQMFCNISKSGCMLTWEFLYKNIDYPLLVKYVGSKDIWDFTDINTEPYTVGYTNYISNYKNDARNVKNKLLIKDNTNIQHIKFIETGHKMIKLKQQEAIRYFANIQIIIETYNNITYNIIDIECSDSSIYKYLVEYATNNFKADVLRILHTITTDTNKKVYSLRSLRDHITVDNIARHFGGNGHPKAAGY